MNCEYHDRVLSYLDAEGSDDAELEAHIAGCPQCSAMVSGYLEAEQKMKLPQTLYQGSSDGLKQQVKNFDKGIGRIVVFTIVGLILGWFSFDYTTVGFWPLKAVIAFPYKLSLWIHTLLHQHSDTEIRYCMLYFQHTDFFPQSTLATMIAGRIVPVLFGGTVYGALAYCTGDKRIFTLQRLMKFLACWAAVIALAVGLSFGINAYQTYQMESLKNIEEIWISPEAGGPSMVWTSGGDSNVYDTLYSGLVQDSGILRDRTQETPITFAWENQKEIMVVLLNCDKQYLVTGQGTIWRISPQFARLIVAAQKGE